MHLVCDFDGTGLGRNLDEGVIDQQKCLSNVQMQYRQVRLALTPILRLDDGLKQGDAWLDLLDSVVLVRQEGVGIFVRGAIGVPGFFDRVGQAGVASGFGGVEAGELGASVLLLDVFQVNISNVGPCFHFYLIFVL